jgi:hypothetical protein
MKQLTAWVMIGQAALSGNNIHEQKPEEKPVK